MFDARLLPLQRRLLHGPARGLRGAGIRADWITLTGFVLGLLAVVAASFGLFWLALAGLLANRLAKTMLFSVLDPPGPLLDLRYIFNAEGIHE